MLKKNNNLDREPHGHLHPQKCKVCGRVDWIDFNVPNDVWDKAVPLEFRNNVVCLPCFDYFALARNVEYGSRMDKEIHFAGQQCIFTAVIRTRSDSNGAV